MATIFSTLDRISQQLFNRTYGWTGVEIGCHTINLAQVRWTNERWQLAAVWSVEHPKTNSNEPSSSSDEDAFGWLTADEIFENGLASTLQSLENLNSLFHGRYCAATLTDGMIDYRELDLPLGELSESKAMARSEIALETECDLEDLLLDCWELPQCNPRATTTCFGAVSIKKSAALTIARDLLRAGFECQTLDAVPCGMARATSMVVDDETISTLAIDLGYHQATITLVKAGQPLFSRAVRSLGLIPLLERISDSFEISKSDAQTLLFQANSDRTVKGETMDGFTSQLQRELGTYLQAISNEVNRTVQYTSRSHRSATPSQLLLMGTGVQIPCLDQALAERVGLECKTWAIELSENLFGNQPIATYAIAAGLSALAWENV